MADGKAGKRSVLRNVVRVILTLCVLALVAAGTAFFFLQTRKGGEEQGTQSSPARGASEVSAFKPTKQQLDNLSLEKIEEKAFRTELITDGKIAIDEGRATSVFSPYSGIVKRINAKPGDPVQSGQLLLTIEATDMVQAQNDFIVAVDALTAADAQIKMAKATEQRQRGMYDAKATALKDLQQSQADLVAAESTLRSAEIALEAVRNRLRILKKTEQEIAEFQKTGKINPETPIYAPIAGTIVQRKVGPGQFITSGASDPTGDPVFVIGDLSTVWLVANIRETDSLELQVGQPIEFKVLSDRKRSYKSHLDYVSDLIDPASRRLNVRATVENIEKKLKPEMFARVVIATSAEQISPAVPRRAIVYEGSLAHVWIESNEGMLELRKIATGVVNDDFVQILAGVKSGDRVVTKGPLFIDRASSGEGG